MNRNRCELILARLYWNCSIMENLRCLTLLPIFYALWRCHDIPSFHFFLFRTNDKKTTGSQRTLHAESMLIRRWYYVDMSKTKFRRISTYLFDIILLIEKSTSFLRTFFDVISMVEKSKLFPHTFFNVISMVEKTTLFPHTFFGVILMVEKSTLFPRTFLM